MPDSTVSHAMARLAERIGPGIGGLAFEIRFAGDDALRLDWCDARVAEEADGRVVMTATAGDRRVRWAFTPIAGGFWVTLDVAADRPLGCTAIDGLVFTFDAGRDVADWLVPTHGRHVEDAGLLRVGNLNARSGEGTLLRGAFADASRPGPFVGTRIPARCLHVHGVRRIGETGLAFTSTTHLTEGLGRATRATAEATWVCATRSLAGALDAYASHLPRRSTGEPPVGWNSWDYYYSAVGAADVVENLEEIERDPVLAEHVRYVVVDMGWNHTVGEWHPNHRFPGGMAPLARRIVDAGRVPGIWTAPVSVDQQSVAGLRGEDRFVRDEHGDPQRGGDGHYLLDPTHPSGEAFLRETYSRLHAEGYRFFKVDYVDGLLEADRFHDPDAGHYDALRALFALIRECVGPESHVLGCSLPPECGPGVADSGRTGVDIHNQWSHAEWAFDFFQLAAWLHGRVWTNDVDFLVVRGEGTSLEERTTVRSPTANRPNPPKWRRGPVFAGVEEARTWGNVVALSGGSVFLGDRLGMLAEPGKAIVRRLLPPTGVAARPLDLGAGPRASLWLQDLADERRLTLINWGDAPAVLRFVFADHGLETPGRVRDLWTGGTAAVEDGACAVRLDCHASAVLTWPRRVDASAPGEQGRA